MKRCTKCNTDRSLDEFAQRRGSLQSWCRPCNTTYQREWYSRNKEKHKATTAQRRRDLAIEVRALLISAKSVPCVDCGECYPPYVMDFDHQGDKLFAVSHGAKFGSLAKVKAEIAKCEVVCSNCHRERTFGAG